MRALSGFPQAWGAKMVSVFGHPGPASYTQVTAVAGTVPISAGGDRVTAPEGGLRNYSYVVAGETDDGAFFVEAIPLTSSDPGTSSAAGSGIPKTSYALRWISRVTAAVGGQNQVAGTEAIAATNLTGETVRLFAIGESA